MPRKPSCECGECRLCKQRECQRGIRLEDVIWPTEGWSRSAREAAEAMYATSTPLAHIGEGRYGIRKAMTARKAGAE